MKRVRVLEEAARDIEQGWDFYDGIIEGLGDYFTDSLMADLDRLEFFHGIHSQHFGLHRMLTARFPFGIYYRDIGEETQVFAILDLRRDPSWIQAKLTGGSR
jgi:hypothetical protein